MSLDKGRHIALITFTNGLTDKLEELSLVANVQLADSAQELSQNKDDLLEFFERFNKFGN